MLLLFEDGVHDFDLESLVELLEVLDHQIENSEAEISSSTDPDGSGCFDRLEGAVGLGFVACQQYIHATYPRLIDDPKLTATKRKLKAIKSPPIHSNRERPIAIAEVINAAANFWKHHDEGVPKPETMDVMNSLVPPSADYKMGKVLYELVKPEPSRFASVVRLLTEWRDLLVDAHV